MAPAALIELGCLAAPNPCGRSNVIVADPTFAELNVVVTPITFLPYPKSSKTLSVVSLVILLRRSSVATSPNAVSYTHLTLPTT